MSPAPNLSWLIGGARRLVRRDTAIAIVATAAAVVPVVLVFAWLFGGAAVWLAPSPAPLILEITAVVAVGAVVFIATRRWLRGLDERDLAADAERRLGLPAGAVRGILELARSVPPGTSPALFKREESEIARRFAGATPRAATGEIGRRVRRRKVIALGGLVALSVVAGGLGFVSPDRRQAGWTPLLHPLAHLTPPPLPALVVSPGDAEVLRGSDLEVRVLAPGRSAVVLLSRAEGDILRRQTVQVFGDSALATVPRIDARTTYWIEAPDGARSAAFTITPLDPLLLSELSVEVIYPAYVGRSSERFDTDIPPLEIPEGTRLEFRGRATRELQEAVLDGGAAGRQVGFRIEGTSFTGRWTPAASGVYEWRLRGGDGTALASGPPPIEITVLPDEAPEVEITFPGVDTVFDPGMVQAIAGDARDDYGLAEAELVSWRVSATGATEPAIETPVELRGLDERALVRAVLDATERNLVAGDTLKYFLRVTDNSARRQTGVSRTYALWLPSIAELRRQTTRDAEALLERAEELTATAGQAQRDTRDLQRRTAASNARRQQTAANGSGSPGGRQSMDFEESEQARQVLEQQEQLAAELDRMRQSLQQLEKAMAAAGLRDKELQERLQELRELYDQILTPELREQLDQLREALEQLDPEQVEQALQQLNAEQERLQEQLEESLDLMRRAAAEQQMNALAQEARELATQQQAVAEEMAQQPVPTEEQTRAQQQLEREAERLAQAMEALEKQLEKQGEEAAAEQTAAAAEGTRQAEQAMQQASQQAAQRQGEKAAESGREAAEKMAQAAETLDGARKAMAERWQQEIQESVQQATNEALSLAQRQQALLDQMKQQEADPLARSNMLPQPPRPPQMGQQSGQQQAGQQKTGQQSGQQRGQQGGKQQGGRQQAGQQQGGRQQAGQQQTGQQQAGQQAGQQGGSQQIGQGGSLEHMRSEQAALQQGLEQLGKNLAEAGERSGLMNRDVGAALGRANLSMQQTLKGLEQAGAQQRLPTQEAAQTVEALNRLALALLNSAQQSEQAQSGTGMQQALQELADLAKQQGALNGQSSALLPLNLTRPAMSQQLQRMARGQREIASRLEGLNEMLGGREDVLGRLDALAKEAEQIARELEGGGLPPEVLARQERLFHRLLDAGRTLERDETSDERVGEAPGDYDPSRAQALDPALLDDGMRYRVPTPEELRGLPPAYRRLILDYFERLNRPAAAGERGRTSR